MVQLYIHTIHYLTLEVLLLAHTSHPLPLLGLPVHTKSPLQLIRSGRRCIVLL
jgi:hypothetical protein